MRRKIGLAVLFTILVYCLIGPYFSPYGLFETNLANANSNISPQHFFGTDSAGRDIATLLMYGGRISLLVSFCVSMIAGVMGSILGMISGFYGGKIDKIIMFFINTIMCIPLVGTVLFCGALCFDMKFSEPVRIAFMILILSLFLFPTLARIVRSKVITLKLNDYVLSAKIKKVSSKKILIRHIFPSLYPYILSNITLIATSACLTESSLSFLGIGIVSPNVSWGSMMKTIIDSYVLEKYPLTWIPAGLMITLTIISINMIGSTSEKSEETK